MKSYDYSRLDPLISISGIPIQTAADWETFRREEIMVLLSNFIYGVRPVERPDDISFSTEIDSEPYLGFPIIHKKIKATFGGYTMPFSLFLPKERFGIAPVPVFLVLLNETYLTRANPWVTPDNPHVPVTDILARGYGCAVISVLDISPDWRHHSEYKKGVFHAVQPDVSKRDNRSWATISGWAFGASRVMDYLETDKDVEHTCVAVIGHSRTGKTALWTGATDPRFALVVDNCSGCTGSAFTREMPENGEHIKDINISDWFCGNYHKYDDNEHMLPCDQHMLLAAIAPRPLYVKTCSEDYWAGPEQMLLSCKLASPVYELYDKKGVVVPQEISPDTPYHKGTIAYHMATGDHDMTRADWQLYMDFADQHLKA